MGEFARCLRRSWRLSRPDVAHAHFWMSGKAALAAAGPLGIPVAQTFHALGVVKRRHQGSSDTSPPQRLAEEARIARLADRLVATCSDEVFELVRLGADPRRVSVNPCGVNLDRFRPVGLVLPRSQRHRLVVVSRLVERKGIGNVISTLPRLPGTELVVAGGPAANLLADDPEAERLLALACGLGVGDRVTLLGRVDQAELPALLRSADLVVCAPWYEPFGMVALEAMACGVPVVATAVGGLAETVIDGVTGLHVPPRRPERLAEAIAALLADPVRRAELGRAGARRARERYDWDRVAASMLDVYSRMACQAQHHDEPVQAARRPLGAGWRRAGG
jgi:glycosyltransferase involved in cell wall biosynthesis